MDGKVAEWVIEFFIAQPSVSDDKLNDLLRLHPHSDNNLCLKKRFLLRKIESEMEKGKASETILDLLSQIEELDCREGNIEVSETLKAAIAAVAMYCYFADEGDISDAEKRIWRVRGGYLNVFVRNSLLRKVALEGPLNMVRVYVDQAKEEIGPPFLELAAGKVLTDDALMEMLGVKKHEEGDEGSGTDKRVKFVDTVNQFLEISRNGYGDMPTPEVNKVHEPPKTSSLDLQAMVDPSCPVDRSAVGSLSKVDVDDPSCTVDRSANALQANDGDLDNGSCKDQNNGPQFSPVD